MIHISVFIFCITLFISNARWYLFKPHHIIFPETPYRIFSDYRPQTKFAKVMFLHLSVSHSVHRGEYLGQVPPRQVHPQGRYTPQAGTPPSRYTPWQVHPQAGTPQAGTPPKQVHPLGRYTPGQVHPPGRHTPPGTNPGQVPPPSRYYEIRSMSGRYASYWNAFLFRTVFERSENDNFGLEI